MDQQKYVEDLKIVSDDIVAQGKLERLLHIIVISILLGGGIYLSKIFIPEYSIPITIAIGVVCIIYELKTHEMITQAGFSIVAGSVEGAQRVKKWDS